MPDWRGYVRQNLKLTRAFPADEASAIEEIARQLEDAYLEALSRGLSPSGCVPLRVRRQRTE